MGAQRSVDRKHGKDVIVEQIKARERERLLQQEILEQEREAMLRQLERLKEEDLLKAEMKKEAAKKLMEEVAASNAQMIRMKELKRQKELEEEQRIATYLEEKAAREQAHQDELIASLLRKRPKSLNFVKCRRRQATRSRSWMLFVQSVQWSSTNESGARKSVHRSRSKKCKTRFFMKHESSRRRRKSGDWNMLQKRSARNSIALCRCRGKQRQWRKRRTRR